MSFTSIGDLSQHFQSLRQTTQVKDRLQVLSQELATGQKSDLASALGGNVGQLLSLDREIALLGDFKQSATQIGHTLGMMQNALETVDFLRERQAATSMTISDASSLPFVDGAAKATRETFEEMVTTLNRSVNGRSLFAGVQTDAPALADATAMLDDLALAVGPATTSDDILAAIDQWFDDPAGGFSSMGYLGSVDGAASRPVSQTQSVDLGATANRTELKDVLRATAIGAMANVMADEIPDDVRRELIQASGLQMVGSATSLNTLRAEVGSQEAFVAEKIVEQEAQLTSFGIMRNGMTTADPYETAVKLQEVQQQLEMQFAVTARLSGLSLVNYI